MKKNAILLILLIGLIVFLSADFTTAQEKKSFTYAPGSSHTSFRKGLDPGTAFDAGSETPHGNLLFEGLVSKNEKGETIPALAKSWKITPDWSYLDFTLREGIKFHNGEPFSAEDVKFSLERYMRDDLQFVFAGSLKEAIDKVEVIDDYQVRLHLKRPFPAFFHLTALFVWMLPKDYIEKVGDEEFSKKPIGTGPFKLVKFIQDQMIELEAVENHWRVKPDFDIYRHLIAPDPATKIAMLKTGELDLAQLPPVAIGQIKQDPKLRVVLSKDAFAASLQLFDVAYDGETPWKDERVRKAASLAIDRQSIIDNVIHGAGQPWGSFLPPYSIGYDASTNNPDPYDPEKAKKLLAEAGYPNGFETRVAYPVWAKGPSIPILQMWEQVGIKVKHEMVEGGTWNSMITSGKTRDRVMYTVEPYWVGGSHPAVGLLDMAGAYFGLDPQPAWWKEAYAKINSAVTDEEVAQAGQEADRLLRESGLFILLFSRHQAFGMGPNVESYEMVPGHQHPFRFEYLKMKK